MTRKRTSRKKPAGAKPDAATPGGAAESEILAAGKAAKERMTREAAAAVADPESVSEPVERKPSFAFATAHQLTSEPATPVPADDAPEIAAAAVEAPAEAADATVASADETERTMEEDASAAYGVGEAGDAATAHDHDTHHPDTHHHDADRGGFASTALTALVGILVVSGLTLWLAPKLAPHMPAGIAQWMAPGSAEMEERIATLEARLAEDRGALESRIATLESDPTAGTMAGEIEVLSGALESLAERLEGTGNGEARAALEAASDELSALAGRADTLETDLGGIRGELASMAEALAAAQNGEGPSTPELAAAIAQVQSRVEGVAQSVDAVRSELGDRIGALDERLGAEIAGIEAALGDAKSRADAAEAEAANARKAEALATLSTAIASGEAYADQLAAAEKVMGTPAPDALAGKAGEGLAQTSVLSEELGPVARQAVAAEIRAEGGEDPVSRAMTFVRANVLSRPVDETEGDDIGAVLSRVDARLAEGDAQAALSELETLPEETRKGLGAWYDRLAERAAAERALADWRKNAGSDS